MGGNGQELYEKVSEVAEDYLGPAAPRYIERLIIARLHKHPFELEPQDIPELIKWVRLSVAVLTEKETIVEEISNRLEALYELPEKSVH